MVHQTPSAAKWLEIIERQEQSGQTVEVFAAKEGLNPRTIGWWWWKLGRSHRSTAATSFVELAVGAPPAPPAIADPTVVLALDHFHAHVIVDTDMALLRKMLEALC